MQRIFLKTLSYNSEKLFIQYGLVPRKKFKVFHRIRNLDNFKKSWKKVIKYWNDIPENDSK